MTLKTMQSSLKPIDRAQIEHVCGLCAVCFSPKAPRPPAVISSATLSLQFGLNWREIAEYQTKEPSSPQPAVERRSRDQY
jgi:hypothetical protein